MSGRKQRKPGRRGSFKGRDALRAENRRFDAVARIFRLTKDERRRLHDEIFGLDLDFDGLKEKAREIFGPAD